MTGVLDLPLPGSSVPPAPGPACSLLREAGIRACCLDDTGGAGIPPAAVHRTVRDLLAAVARSYPGYTSEVVAGGLLNVYPEKSVLDDPVAPRRTHGEGLWQVLDSLLPQYHLELFQEFRDGDGPAVTADLPGGPLRAALNALVVQVPGTVWHISGTREASYLTITAIG